MGDEQLCWFRGANVDLFNVLKGGGNNFGTVSRYTLQVHPMAEVRENHHLLVH